MNRRELAALIEEHGHRLEVAESVTGSGRSFIHCSCGYRSAGRNSLADAIEGAEHHALQALAEIRRNGGRVSTPSVGASL